MTASEARVIVYNHFKDNWSPPNPAVTNYVFDNEAFDPEGISEWLKVSMKGTGGGQETLGESGNRVFRRRAVLQIQIYTTVDQGLLRLDALAEAARDLFEAKTISLVMFNNSTYLEDIEEKETKGLWVKGLVQIFFSYDQIK